MSHQPEIESSDGWASAVLELKEVDTQPTPTLKLRALLNTARAIYTTVTLLPPPPPPLPATCLGVSR